MKRTWTLALSILFAVLVAGCGTLSPSGEYVLGSGQTLRGDLMITSDRATLAENSRVTGNVILTSGELYVEEGAQIGGSVVMFSGDIFLSSGAVVRGGVIRTSGDVHQEEGARIQGGISSNIAGFIVSYVARTITLYCLLPLVVIGVLVGVVVFLIIRMRRRPVAEVPVAQAPAPAAPEDPSRKLNQLKAMLDDGLITEEDYEAKKAEILSKM